MNHTQNFTVSDLRLKPVFPIGTVFQTNDGNTKFTVGEEGFLSLQPDGGNGASESTTTADMVAGNPAVTPVALPKKKKDDPDDLFQLMKGKMTAQMQPKGEAKKPEDDMPDDMPDDPDMKKTKKHMMMRVDVANGMMTLRMRHENTEHCPHKGTEECPCSEDYTFPVAETCANAVACVHGNCFKCPYQVGEQYTEMMMMPDMPGSMQDMYGKQRQAMNETTMPCDHDGYMAYMLANFEDKMMVRCMECDKIYEYPVDMADDGCTMGEPSEVEMQMVHKSMEQAQIDGREYIFSEGKIKREAGTDWGPEWFAYVPDADKPSTWKLRMGELVDGTKKITVRQLGRAAAAFSKGGFRGKKVQMPSGDVGAVKAKLRAAYKKLGAEVPDSIKECATLWGISEEDAEFAKNLLTSEEEDGNILAESEDSSSAVSMETPISEAAPLQQETCHEEIRETPTFYGKTVGEEVADETGVKTLKIFGVCGKFNEKTENGRVYPISIYTTNRSDIEEQIANGRFIGEIDHPHDGRGLWERTCVKFTSITPKLSDGRTVEEAVTDEPYKVHYAAEVAPTHLGKDLITLIKAGFGIEWSSRGYGSAKVAEWKGEKATILQDDFKFLGYDSVIGAATTGTGVTHYEARNGLPVEDGQTEETPVVEVQETEPKTATELPVTEPSTMEVPEMAEEKVEVTPVTETSPPVVEAPQAPPDFTKLIQDAVAAALPSVLEGVSKTAQETTVTAMAAVETNKAATTAKINELCGSEEVPVDYREVLRKHISQGNTPDAVQTRFDTHLPVIKEMAELAVQAQKVKETVPAVDALYAGIGIVRQQDVTEMLTPNGDRVTRPNDIQTLIRTASEGIPVERLGRKLDAKEEAEYKKVGFKGLGLPATPLNPRWTFERILWNWAFQTDATGERHPTDYIRYLNVHTQEGYENFMRNRHYYAESTLTSDLTAGNPQMLPIFRAVFPRLIANEIVTTYPISVPVATVFLMEPQYDSGWSSAQNLSNTQYFTYTWATHTEGAAKAELQLTMTSATITAIEKAINIVWSEQASQDLNAYFNLNLESELVRTASDYIARELNHYILNQILTGSGVLNVNYGTAKPSAYQSVLEYRKDLMGAVDKLGAQIASARSQRPDWIVAGNMEIARLASMSDRWETDITDNTQRQFGVGLNRVGTFNGRYRVYECDWWNEAGGNNKILVGITPQDWNNTGYLFCPYIPLYQTPTQVTTSTNLYSRAIGTRFGTRLHKAACFGTVTIQPGVDTGDPLA